ncbi:MAG: DEAD/DEAH box helicase family protein [Paracholeplasma sp.]|nr:DEAD/DEAH box helicase family protein [Paracholeplasma sp.]MDY3195493.1 DEAD/DEAH box helicase family protein [Paracholeplasma sp.]
MKTLNIQRKYRSNANDILNDFYIPVLSKSKYYLRAVGYFSSSILLDYLKGLRNFVNNDGVMNLLVSPYLTQNDIDELSKFSNNQYSIQILEKEFEQMMNSSIEEINAAKLMILLLSKKILNIKIVEPDNINGLFHEKIGIFIDKYTDFIAINGSNNETRNSLNINHESFNAFCSWLPGQADYADDHYTDFNNYWLGRIENAKVIELDDAVVNNLLKKYEVTESIEELFSLMVNEENDYNQPVRKFIPYKHQMDALELWMDKKKGILKFATGSGKTKTAILIMEELKKTVSKELFVIVVPDKTLVNQWYDEVIDYSNQVIKCYSDSQWESALTDLSYDYMDLNFRHQYIITTNDTFFGDRFQRVFRRFKNDYFLIVDECHTWSTNRILERLPKPSKILGLSATPEIYYSNEKTIKLLEYFGGILLEYSLKNAIDDKRLVGYKYYPIVVGLSLEEKQSYEELTNRIVKYLGHDADDYKDTYDKALEMLLFKRARIVYGAINKIEVLQQIIDKIEKKGNLLIYCGPTSYTTELLNDTEEESISQLRLVNKILIEKGIQFTQYTSKENSIERESAINMFKNRTYSTLVAIKCLDEGVDIPSIERAIILASSTNPREFIQRRGRIIRNSIGKKYAEIYDFIVLDDDYDSLVKKELARFYEFSSLAINLSELEVLHKKLFDKYNEMGVDKNE